MYDRALTVFSPDGRLFQVEYAQEAVNKGSLTVVLKTKSGLVICSEKPRLADFEVYKRKYKFVTIDEGTYATYSGLSADAQMLFVQIKKFVQQYRMDYDTRVTLKMLATEVAALQQKYTQRGGTRPVGVSVVLFGLENGRPELYVTDPSGVHLAWKAVAIGQSSKTTMEYLEKAYNLVDDDEAIVLSLRALLEGVEADSKSIEVVVVKREMEFLSEETISGYLEKALQAKKEETREASMELR